VGYRIRILGKNLTMPRFEELRKAASPAVLEGDEGVGDNWEALHLKHKSGRPIAYIERNPVIEGELGFDEIREFDDEVLHYKPDSAAAWLKSYFPCVKVIYSFQLLSGTDIDDGYSLMHKVYGVVWKYAGGILQADQEGFSNEGGYTILWQFSEEVEGSWDAGVLGPDGRWLNFEMDLGNRAHREAFLRGVVPTGAKNLP